MDLSRGQVDLSILNFCKSLVWNVKMIDGRDRVDSRMWVEEKSRSMDGRLSILKSIDRIFIGIN